eukprot:COSAG02_NODE_570_length_20203_cov_8.049990_6_plen_99_part_00
MPLHRQQDWPPLLETSTWSVVARVVDDHITTTDSLEVARGLLTQCADIVHPVIGNGVEGGVRIGSAVRHVAHTHTCHCRVSRKPESVSRNSAVPSKFG